MQTVSEDERAPGELPPQGIDTGPRARTLGLALLAGWLLLHVSVPLSYYLSSDVYDERFAWRMFSAVRVQECALDARETIAGVERPIALQSVLPAPWVSLLQRNRPAVLRRFLEWRCASDVAPSRVRLTHTCRSASGDALPAVHRTLQCAEHAYEETTDE